ncbi:helix-turn-helix domain-containing protein [Streptomyces sp. NPDC096046]|uniref:nSTAND1 domain-containing NTPase n=1 Tax=Streptomyces sp. NPDC096046 TaxID=3155542 RepID=UPI00332DD425
MAGRREVPVDPGAGPVQRFAFELRKLRTEAGGMTYRAMAERAGYSGTTLSQAAAGERLPTLAVTLAYVAACGGNAGEWEARWKQIVDDAAAVGAEEVGGEGADAPYRGLARFEPGDSGLFFGRDRLTTDLLDLLRRRRFAAVFGPSGSGKSSLLRAGLIPTLQHSQEPGLRPAVIQILTPGDHPARAHAPLLDASRPGDGGTDTFVIVDQFEEVYTLCHDIAERTRFIDLLLAARQPTSRLRVLIAVRADFYGRCAEHHGLADALRDANLLVSPMSPAELREAIVKPATATGLTVERALTARVIRDVADESGGLPLMSHALLETWRRRRGRVLTEAAYDAVGGVSGAIARTAERLYTRLSPEQAAVARDLLLRLITPGEGAQDTRRPALRTELAASTGGDAALVLERLARARLVTLDDDTVDLAHEALITAWPRLRMWIETDRELLRAHRRLTNTAGEWAEHGRDDGVLYRGVRLAEWDDRDTGRLNDLEHEFLAASRDRAQAERAAVRRRVRLTVSGLTAAVVALTVLAGVAFVQARRAEAGQALAFSRQLVASARGQAQLDPELGLLLATSAYRTSATDETEAALRQAVFESRVRAVLASHDGQVLGVSFSPDGRYLATSGGDGAIRVWRYGTTLRDPVVLRGRDGEVWTPVFSPDGTRITAAGEDGTVSVWKWASGAEPVILRGHTAQVWSATFSPDGRKVASAGDDGTVRIWNATGRGEPVVLRGHDGRALGVSFSPDGRRLASSGGDGTVRVWDVGSRRTTVVLRGHGNSVEAVAFSPDGQRIATASTDGTARLWDPDAPAESVVLGSHDGTAEGIGFSRDGARVASTGNDGTVRIWNVHHRAAPLILRGHRGTVTAVAFAADGRRLVSASEDGTVRIWEAAPTGSDSVLTGHDGPVWATVPSRDGRRLASAGADGTVRVWRTGSTAPPTVLRGHDGEVLGVAFSPDGRQVAGTGDDGTTRIWPVDNATKPVVLRGHDGPVWTAEFSPDGRRLVTGGSDGTVRIWRTTPGAEPLVVDTGQDKVRYVAYSPDGRRVAAAGLDGTIHVLDPATGKDLKVLRGHKGLVWTVAFSPDGRHLVSGGNDGSARLWDLTKPGRPRVLNGHQGVVWSVSFGPDGRRVVTSGNDATTRIWSTTDNSPPVVLHGFGASVENTNVLPGNRFVSSHDDGTVRVWTCLPCEPIDEVLRRSRDGITRGLTQEERAGYLNESAG